LKVQLPDAGRPALGRVAYGVRLITIFERLTIWNYWRVSRIMSVRSVILWVSRERRSEMNLEEYKAYVLETRKANAEKAMSVLSATISTTKKEGSK